MLVFLFNAHSTFIFFYYSQVISNLVLYYSTSASVSLLFNIGAVVLVLFVVQYITGILVSGYSSNVIISLSHFIVVVLIFILLTLHISRLYTHNHLRYINFVHVLLLFMLYVVLYGVTVLGYVMYLSFMSVEAITIILSLVLFTLFASEALIYAVLLLHVLVSIILAVLIVYHLILLHAVTHQNTSSVAFSSSLVTLFYDLIIVDVSVILVVISIAAVVLNLLSIQLYYSSELALPLTVLLALFSIIQYYNYLITVSSFLIISSINTYVVYTSTLLYALMLFALKEKGRSYNEVFFLELFEEFKLEGKQERRITLFYADVKDYVVFNEFKGKIVNEDGIAGVLIITRGENEEFVYRFESVRTKRAGFVPLTPIHSGMVGLQISKFISTKSKFRIQFTHDGINITFGYIFVNYTPLAPVPAKLSTFEGFTFLRLNYSRNPYKFALLQFPEPYTYFTHSSSGIKLRVSNPYPMHPYRRAVPFIHPDDDKKNKK